MNIHNTDTFNNKPIWRNAVAVVLGVIGIYILAHAWAYHMLVQLVTIPKDAWINPLDEVNVPETVEYPNKFCDVLCTVEATMMHQLKLLREGFGKEYCNEITGEEDATRV